MGRTRHRPTPIHDKSPAGLVYAAWLMQYRGCTPDQAMRMLTDTDGWPPPLEKLLGRPLTLQFAPQTQ